MSLFRTREMPAGLPILPRAAVCFTTPAMTRRAADWLKKLGGCQPVAILSDDCDDVAWQCEAEQADLLLLETDFSEASEDTRDVSARCDVAIEVKRRLPACRVYLLCEEGHPEKLPALDKAVELKLIDGYYVGDLPARQGRSWIAETVRSLSGQTGGHGITDKR